jgi:hypothetical protein
VEEYGSSSIGTGNEAGKLPNTAPNIVSVVVENTELRPRRETGICIQAKDDEADKLKYSAKVGGGSLIGLSSVSPVMQWVAPETSGSYEITAMVTDEKGAVSQKAITVRVSPVAEAAPYSLVRAFGGGAKGFSPFSAVTDIEMDEAGNLWALDEKDNLLRISSPTGAVLGAIDLAGGESSFGASPSKMCLDTKGGAYILDIPHKTLNRMDAEGKSARMIFDSATRGDFLLETPSDIVCTKEGDLLISDSTSGHVVAIDGAGQFLLPAREPMRLN